MSTTIGQVLTLNPIIWKQISTTMVKYDVNTEETIPYYRGTIKAYHPCKKLCLCYKTVFCVCCHHSILNSKNPLRATKHGSAFQWFSPLISRQCKYLSYLATVRILEWPSRSRYAASCLIERGFIIKLCDLESTN